MINLGGAVPGNTVMNMSLGTRSNSLKLNTSGVSSVGTGDISDAMLMHFMVSAATVLCKSPAFVIKRSFCVFTKQTISFFFAPSDVFFFVVVVVLVLSVCARRF